MKAKDLIEYQMYGYPYRVTMDHTETLEEVMKRIPTVCGM